MRVVLGESLRVPGTLHVTWLVVVKAMLRGLVGAAVSRGSAILTSLDEHLNEDELGEEVSVDAEALEAMEPVSAEEVELDESQCGSCEVLRGKIAKLQRMVVSLEQSLEEEQLANKETSAKLSMAMTESSTIDSLVDEYSKLSTEAAKQAEADGQRIAELLVRDEEQRAKLNIFEAQIMSLTEADDAKISDLVSSGAVTVGVEKGRSGLAVVQASYLSSFRFEAQCSLICLGVVLISRQALGESRAFLLTDVIATNFDRRKTTRSKSPPVSVSST